MVVHGSVQGVGFRWSCRVHAQRLGVTGWVRNLADGSVEAFVEGEDRAVDEMVAWLRSGPPGAGVRRVDVEEAAARSGSGFEITD